MLAGAAPPPSFCEHPLIFPEAAETPDHSPRTKMSVDIQGEGSEQCRNVCGRGEGEGGHVEGRGQGQVRTGDTGTLRWKSPGEGSRGWPKEPGAGEELRSQSLQLETAVVTGSHYWRPTRRSSPGGGTRKTNRQHRCSLC